MSTVQTRGYPESACIHHSELGHFVAHQAPIPTGRSLYYPIEHVSIRIHDRATITTLTV
jgi:hypothetical protein